MALIAARNGDSDPGNDVVFITVDIGGNDLFHPVINNCSGGVTPTCVSTIGSLFTTYANNLALILGSLRAAAGPDAKIAVMTYYNPLGACFLAPLEPLANVVLEGGGPLALGFNDLIRAIAAATNVSLVETYGLLEVDDLVGGQDCLHADESGYHKIAKVFRDVLG